MARIALRGPVYAKPINIINNATIWEMQCTNNSPDVDLNQEFTYDLRPALFDYAPTKFEIDRVIDFAYGDKAKAIHYPERARLLPGSRSPFMEIINDGLYRGRYIYHSDNDERETGILRADSGNYFGYKMYNFGYYFIDSCELAKLEQGSLATNWLESMKIITQHRKFNLDIPSFFDDNLDYFLDTYKRFQTLELKYPITNWPTQDETIGWRESCKNQTQD